MKHIDVLFMLFSISNSFGQDIILMKDSELVRAKITKITNDIVQYNRYDNLDGPLYELPTSLIAKIDFENGTSTSFSKNVIIEKMTLDETKAFIVQSINNFAYERDGDKAYTGSFEGNYLKLSRRNTQTNEIYDNYRLYDFSAECEFHDLSKRGSGISYINVYVPRVVDGESNYGYKLVICVKDYEKGQLLLEALKKYNKFFKED